jgi:hypothetical protein
LDFDSEKLKVAKRQLKLENCILKNRNLKVGAEKQKRKS